MRLCRDDAARADRPRRSRGRRDREKADLVVVGSGGASELARWALGSIAHRLVHIARRPVAVVRAGARMKPRPARILVATDGSKPSREALRLGVRLAAAVPRARLAVVTISTVASDVVLTGAGLVRAAGIMPELARAERKAGEKILRAAARRLAASANGCG
jgi:nucleotide-binding universal stress UspA family protein